MPGIVDASVKCENRGSIKKATVNIKCYSPEQFRILEVLYLRLGYTVFLEFGWSSYLDGGTLKNSSSTLIETEFFKLQKGAKYVDFLKKIEEERKSKKGNYDGLLCKVSNFSWTFSQDGSYDIELSLITMGDVIESLKTNVKPSKGIVDLISEKYALYGNEVAPTDEEAMDTNVPPAPAQDLISAYLFLQRVYVADKTTNPDYYNGKNDTGTTVSGVAINVSNIFIKQGTGLKLKTPASEKDFLYFSYNDLENDEDVLNNEGFYIRFGHLINFIRDNIILKSKKSNEPIIEIDKDFETAKMYVFPYQVSLDPRVCIVGTKEQISAKAFYTNLPVWNDIKGFGANIANIYLNGAMVSRVLSEKKDEEGNISLYEMLNTICSELNRALGSVNNLETIIDEETMSIKIIDSSLPLIKPISSAKLELYGYNGNKSNFVYDFNIKTEITNDFATMVTIGATAGGYAKGTENTMFSKWNKGLEDIFKEDYIPPTQTGDNDEDPPNNVYASEFWMKRYAPFGLTYPQDIEDDVTTPDACALSPEIIDKNIELVSEFYKYCQYKIQQKNQKYASPTNGFIPISLGITLEGISGIKIYNAVNVNTRFLPSNYPNNLNFIIKGVNHKISDGKWETNLETVVIAKSEKEGILKYSDIRAYVLKEIKAGVAASKANAAETTAFIQQDQSNRAPLTLATVTALISAAAASFQPTINPDGSPVTLDSNGLAPIPGQYNNLKAIINFIFKGESNKGDPNIYNIGVYKQCMQIASGTPGSSYYKPTAVNLSNLTAKQVLEIQRWKGGENPIGVKKDCPGNGVFNTSLFAVGIFQMIPGTCYNAVKYLNAWNWKFDYEGQINIGVGYLVIGPKRKNLTAYLKGTNTGTQAHLKSAVDDLAMEWASCAIAGDISRGTSLKGYYGGQGGKKSAAESANALIESRIQYSKNIPSYFPTYYNGPRSATPS